MGFRKKDRIVPQAKYRLKKGDEVVVTAGEDKGRRGKILHVDTETNRATVEGVNRRKRHQRPTQKNPHGGIVEKELPVHVSNLMLWDAKAGKGSRVGIKREDDGTRVRVLRASGETVEG